MKKIILFFSLLSLSSAALSQCQAFFTSSVNGGTATFANGSTGTNLNYSWSFGDGNNSTQMQPSHTYTTTGYYAVCLTIYSTDSLNFCQDSYCDSIYVMADSTAGTGCNLSSSAYANPNGTIVGTASGASTYGWDVYSSNWSLLYSTTGSSLSYNPGATGAYNVCVFAYDSLQQYCDSNCYVVNVNDSTGGNGCNVTASVTGNQNGTISGTATGAFSYYWDIYDANWGYVASYNGSNFTHTSANPGVYNVCLIPYDSLQTICDTLCFVVATDSTAGLNALENDAISVFPNPASDHVTIVALTDEIRHLQLIDVTGSLVRSATVSGAKAMITLEGLPEGMYFIHALGNEGQQLSSCKIIKR